APRRATRAAALLSPSRAGARAGCALGARPRRARCGDTPAGRVRALGAEPRRLARARDLRRGADAAVAARSRAHVLAPRWGARLDAARRSRGTSAALDRRPARARGRALRRGPGADGCAGLLVHAALSRV